MQKYYYKTVISCTYQKKQLTRAKVESLEEKGGTRKEKGKVLLFGVARLANTI